MSNDHPLYYVLIGFFALGAIIQAAAIMDITGQLESEQAAHLLSLAELQDYKARCGPQSVKLPCNTDSGTCDVWYLPTPNAKD